MNRGIIDLTSGNVGVTAGASGVWGSWTTFVAANTFKVPLKGFFIQTSLAPGTLGAFQIGIGSTPNIIMPGDMFNANLGGIVRYYPLFVPAGVEIQIRAMSFNTTTGPFAFSLIGSATSRILSAATMQFYGLDPSTETQGVVTSAANTWTLIGTLEALPTKFVRLQYLDETTGTNLITFGVGPSSSSVTAIKSNLITGYGFGLGYGYEILEEEMNLPAGQGLYAQVSSTNVSYLSAYVFY